MNSIDEFVRSLTKRRNTSSMSNPYLDVDLANNLRVYLNAMQAYSEDHVLLVGEALGYKGGKLTGIPFSSGQIYQRFAHPFLSQIAQQLKIDQVESENTATIVWEYLTDRARTPLFWNAFPFHPHPKGNKQQNRAPTSKELNTGKKFLYKLSEIYRPKRIAGIGHKGAECARRAFPNQEIITIRHPSYGGKTEFINGLDGIL